MHVRYENVCASSGMPACENLGICGDQVKSEIFWQLTFFLELWPQCDNDFKVCQHET